MAAGGDIPGFEQLDPRRNDELGYWFAAVHLGTGQVVTVRVVTVDIGSAQLADLDRLWSELARRSLPASIPAVVAHGATAAGRAWVATDGPPGLPWPDLYGEVRDLGVDICEALAALHQAGLAHGRVTAAAIVWSQAGWQLRDVGIAAIVLPDEVGPWTAPEVLVRPELAATAAADVYGLGLELVGLDVQRPRAEYSSPSRTDDLLRFALLDATRADPRQRPSAAALGRMLTPFSRLLVDGPRPEPKPYGGVPAASTTTEQSHPIDEDVQFTVYRPTMVAPGRWYDLLAFAHKTNPRADGTGPADPMEEVGRLARQVLGPDAGDFGLSAADSDRGLVWGSDLRFVPRIHGVEFNPPSRSFQWKEAVHWEVFRLRADAGLDGQTTRGHLSVFLGAVLVADVRLAITVDSALAVGAAPRPHQIESARPYRKIFVSYSHRDRAVVDQVATFIGLLGDDYVRDSTHLRSGQAWSDGLAAMIRGADVFQLFWSTNSMLSPFVQQEWTYALSLKRPSFVRPVYWEVPLPARPDLDLPPEALRRLHFQRLAAGVAPLARTGVSVLPERREHQRPAEGGEHQRPADLWIVGSPRLPSSRPTVEWPRPESPRPPPPVSPPSPPRSRPSVPRPPRAANKRLPNLVLAAMVSVAVVVGVVAYVNSGGPPSPPTPTSSTPTSTSTTTTTRVPTVVAALVARADRATICVAGTQPDTTSVTVSARPPLQVGAASLLSTQNGVETRIGLSRSAVGSDFTATLGPFDQPGVATWTAEVTAADGTTLRSAETTLAVVAC